MICNIARKFLTYRPSRRCELQRDSPFPDPTLRNVQHQHHIQYQRLDRPDQPHVRRLRYRCPIRQIPVSAAKISERRLQHVEAQHSGVRALLVRSVHQRGNTEWLGT
jgi:hypothetical protein